ncbi:hypothetical protein BDW74DRAFT_138050 [Aspergillus multicolor]|uniref:uncharacterized protein n=1 Tax=Aspergillus multicolor TaxID=41759 RepID=UPI003CCE15D8
MLCLQAVVLLHHALPFSYLTLPSSLTLYLPSPLHPILPLFSSSSRHTPLLFAYTFFSYTLCSVFVQFLFISIISGLPDTSANYSTYSRTDKQLPTCQVTGPSANHCQLPGCATNNLHLHLHLHLVSVSPGFIDLTI